MCLAIPVQVEKILPEQNAIVNIGGIRREISTVLLDNVSIGDFVIVHVGYALSKLDEIEAQKTLSLFQGLLTQGDK